MRSTLLRVLQGAVAAAVIGFAGWQLVHNWNAVRAAKVALAFHVLPLLGALLLVWVGFGALILAWRATVEAAGRPLTRRDAAQIWTVSSLGKYLPGKVWALAGMMVMAREKRVSGRVAAAASIFQQVVSLGTGALLVFVSGRAQLIDLLPGGRAAFAVLLAGAVVALALPLSDRVMAMAATAFQAVRRTPAVSGDVEGESAALAALPPMVLLQSISANVVAWLAYAGALLLLAQGLIPSLSGELTLARALGGFTAAYLAGVLAFLAPGGLGVREGLIVLLLAPAVGQGGAAVLALATRVLFTIAEVGAAAPFVLAAKEKSRGTV